MRRIKTPRSAPEEDASPLAADSICRGDPRAGPGPPVHLSTGTSAGCYVEALPARVLGLIILRMAAFRPWTSDKILNLEPRFFLLEIFVEKKYFLALSNFTAQSRLSVTMRRYMYMYLSIELSRGLERDLMIL